MIGERTISMNRIFVTRLARVALAAVILATTSSLVPAAVQPVEASHNHGKIGCGTLVEGTITTSDYNDFWIFSGEADDQVTIRMTSTSGNLDSQVTLWLKDSNGSSYHLLKMAGTAGGNSDAVISNFTLPKTGTYAVGSRRFNGNQGTTTGSYKLTLTCSNDLSGGNSSNSCPKPGGSINWENMITAYNTHNRVETPDGDFWAFRANSGDRIQLWLKSDFFRILGCISMSQVGKD